MAELKIVDRVQFGVINPLELEQLSVCEVKSPATYQDGVPVEGGLLDQRMGVTDRGLKCLTCNMEETVCPGHFGHIKLAEPVVHCGFAKVIHSVLRCVCFHCSRLLLDKNKPEYKRIVAISHPQTRLHQFAEACAGIRVCRGGATTEAVRQSIYGEMGAEGEQTAGGCSGSQPMFRRDAFRIYRQIIKKVSKKKGSDEMTDAQMDEHDNNDAAEIAELSASEVLEILSRISDLDVLALGFNPVWAHPKWLITTILPVPPPQVRPSVTFNGTDRSADDITAALAQIVSINNDITKQKENFATATQLKDNIYRLTLSCAQLVNNEMSNQEQMKTKSGKILKTLRQRIVGKGGRIRSNLMGKRVNFCARTVITGDPNLGIDFVGVPRWVARTLTYPEVVTEHNKERLMQLVRNGPEQYPGAQRVIKLDKQIIHLKHAAKNGEINLEPGYIVERHLIDDDYILFNRQPSLHKMSLMGHKAKVMPFSSFRLNLSCTSPYNADFDGDEMNLHVAQTPVLRAEISEIMLSPRQIVSPQASKPVMSIVQDSLLGVSKFTRRDTFCDRNLTNNLLMTVDNWNGEVPQPAILKPTPLWTGKQIFSLIIPKGVNLVRSSKHVKKEPNVNLSVHDAAVLITNGQLLTGIVDGNTVGKVAGGLIHIIWLEKGWDDTRQFMTGCQKLVNNWLVTHGFSVGISDLVADKKTMDVVNSLIEQSDHKVQEIIQLARTGKLERKPGHSIISTFESSVNTALNETIKNAGQNVQDQLSRDNAINAMVYAGSKGSHLNISQIVACVGQQNVSGKRVPFSFRRRSLPHFQKEDVGLASRGFVARSYMKGLLPTEFYFHACGGREGLVDTAVKTAETGYIQRRLVKSMESIKAHYDTTVRNSLGDIVQFVYGEDGMDGCYVEKLSVDYMKLNNQDMQSGYYFDIEDDNLVNSLLTEEVRVEMMEDENAKVKLQQEFKRLVEDRTLLRGGGVMKIGVDEVHLPCNVPRIIANAQHNFGIKLEGGINQGRGVIRLDLGHKSDLSPLEVIEGVEKLCSSLIVVPGKSALAKEAQENATTLFKIYIRHVLASKRVLGEYHLDKASFNSVLGEIKTRFQQALVHPGEMVGAIAAQSIGEPATQMTLNTFHLAGYSAKNVTSGVPRLVEIINVATNVKMSGMSVELKDKKVAADESAVRTVLNKLEYTRVCDIAQAVEIYHDPIPTECVVEEDRSVIEDYLAMPDDEYDLDKFQRSAPWLLRIILNRQVAQGKDLAPSQIAMTINQFFSASRDKIYCIATSNTSATTWVLHIRFQPPSDASAVEFEDDPLLKMCESIKNTVLNNIKLCGITGITKIFLQKEKAPFFDKETGAFNEGAELWTLETEGTNFKEVIVHPDVDHTTCYSNFCPDLLAVCGIEATRAAVLKELRSVIESDGSYISYRHIAMLVDIMTFKGALMSITRNGFNRLHTGPLMRCSFEESVEILMEAAAFSETDPLSGISEKVMMGQLADIGTGSFDVVLDVKKLTQLSDITTQTNDTYNPTYIDPTIDHSMGDETLPNIQFGEMVSPNYNNVTSSVYAPSPQYNAMSPAYVAPISGAYSPTSPGYAVNPTSTSYSPTSPGYSPTSPGYSPTSPGYSPTSPGYSPTSPGYSPTSPAHLSPTSPGYSPTSPGYSPTSPGYSPTSPGYSPTSPGYSPTSPGYSPTSPGYSPTSPGYSPTSPGYSPTSPGYSPTSPGYSPNDGSGDSPSRD